MQKGFRPVLFFLAAHLIFTAPAFSQEAALTAEALEQQGHMSLSSAALEKLVVGRTLNVKSLADGTLYEMVFFADGYRLLHNPKKSPASAAGREGIAVYEVTAGRLVTRLGASIFDVRIYEADGRYLAADERGGGDVAWEVFPREDEPVQPALTITALAQAGIMPLDDEALRSFVVGRTLVLKNRKTGLRHKALFRDDGMREIKNARSGSAEEPLAYEIANGWINTALESRDYRIRIYRVGDAHLAAHSGDGGAVNWEIVSSR